MSAFSSSPAVTKEKEQEKFPLSSFLPYACHVDPHTILTKNGELLQVIRIMEGQYETPGQEEPDLREALRKALRAALPGTQYALWTHMVRKKKDLTSEAKCPDHFSNYVNGVWNEKLGLEQSYVNEFYITVLREGPSGKLYDRKSLLRGFVPAWEKRYQNAMIEKAREEIDDTVLALMKELGIFAPHRLGFIERDGVIWSEPLRFFDFLLHGFERDIALPEAGLNDYLPDHLIDFGYHAFEVRGHENHHVGAVLMVKNYRDIPGTILRPFLYMDQAFTISQSLDFIDRNQAEAEYKAVAHVMQLGEDEDIYELSGVDRVFEKDAQTKLDYVQQETLICLRAANEEELDKAVQRTLALFSERGIVAIREDVMMEDGFWAGMPGNFAFLKRVAPIHLNHAFGFAAIGQVPTGISYNKWGRAATIFHTIYKTPYFFNFHLKGAGHTLVLGQKDPDRESDKNKLVNFLLASARKYDPKIIYLDYGRSGEGLIRAMGGTYLEPSYRDTRNTLHLNPFQLPVSEDSRGFVEVWLEALIRQAGEPLEVPEWQGVLEVVDALYHLDMPERRMGTLVGLLRKEGLSHAARLLSRWADGGRYGAVFDHAEDSFDLSPDVLGVSLRHYADDPDILAVVMLYILFRINMTLSNRPEILVVDEAWKLLDHAAVRPLLGEWLDYLTQHEALAILTSEDGEEAARSAMTSALLGQILSRIFLPVPQPGIVYKQGFQLTDKDLSLLRKLQDKPHFMLKRGDQTVVCEFSLECMPEVAGLMAGQEGALQLMQELIYAEGDDPVFWLPRFLEQAGGH